MIEVKDYRVGNYFMIDGSTYIVDRIDKHNIYGSMVKKAAGMHTNGGQRCPIIIDEVLLKDCDFKYNNIGGFWFIVKRFDNIEYRVKYKDYEEYIFSIGVGDFDAELCFINYFHELQNIVWQLDKKELNLKYDSKTI